RNATSSGIQPIFRIDARPSEGEIQRLFFGHWKQISASSLPHAYLSGAWPALCCSPLIRALHQGACHGPLGRPTDDRNAVLDQRSRLLPEARGRAVSSGLWAASGGAEQRGNRSYRERWTPLEPTRPQGKGAASAAPRLRRPHVR